MSIYSKTALAQHFRHKKWRAEERRGAARPSPPERGAHYTPWLEPRPAWVLGARHGHEPAHNDRDQVRPHWRTAGARPPSLPATELRAGNRRASRRGHRSSDRDVAHDQRVGAAS